MDNRYPYDEMKRDVQEQRSEERTVYEVYSPLDGSQTLEAVKRPSPERPRGNGSRGRGIFPAFMAGALLIGSLMFASDHYNLFTGDSPTSAGTGSPQVQNVSFNPAVGTNSIADIAEKAGPAVVRIGAETRQGGGVNWYGMQSNSSQGELAESGLGTGFLFDADGYILTNEHVIHGAEKVTVKLQGYDEPFVAQVVGSSYELDLAVLKIQGDKPFPYLELGESDQMKIGEWVVAIGNPYDLDYTVTTGVLSASEREISIPDQEGTRNYKHLLQTDTAINPGNSGGPLLNMNGQVIGINTAVSSEAQGIGFAIPTSTIKSVLDNLLSDTPIPSPYIGVSLQDLTSQMRSNLGLGEDEGVGVAYVQAEDPAGQAGLQPGDIIVAANGDKIGNAKDLTSIIQNAGVGDELKLTVKREDQQLTIDVRIGDRSQAATMG